MTVNFSIVMQSIIYIPGTLGPGTQFDNICSLSIGFILFASLKIIISYLLQLSLMPSTRKQKVKARKSREMDMMSDFENMDVMIGNENTNPIERELSNKIGNGVNDQDIESNPQSSRYETHENELGHYAHENAIPRQDRVQQTLETFTSEFNKRLSQKMDSMMSLMHSKTNRAKSAAIIESNCRDSKYSEFDFILRESQH